MEKEVYKKEPPPGRPPRRWVSVLLVVLLALVVLAAVGLVIVLLLPRPGPAAPVAASPSAGPAQAEEDTRPVLVLDAGHGGIDPGALTPDESIHEAVVNQQVAGKLADLLALHDGSLRVVFSHEADSFAQPQERAAVAVAEEAGLLLSLHLNSHEDTSVRGFQVFPVPPGRPHHAASKALAEQLVAEVEDATSLPIRGSGVFYTFYVPTGWGSYHREVIDDIWFDVSQPRAEESYGVLDKAGCPALLVEQWYISNRRDMAAMYTEPGMDLMVRCLYRVVCAHFGLDARR